MVVILGGGLAGISCSYHIGHEKCLILERESTLGGHISSDFRNEFTWDQGPHVSFTSDEYVEGLFANGTDNDFEEFEVLIRNYYRGIWIDNPSQSFLHQIPEPLRSKCLESFLDARANNGNNTGKPVNYEEWLNQAFGKVFSENFSKVYTKKYWTCEPSELGVDWIGNRIFSPKIEDVIEGYKGSNRASNHYIKTVRYPTYGGFQSFANKLVRGANVHLNTGVSRVNLKEKKIFTSNGSIFKYETLINTIPLPDFIGICEGVPDSVKEAVKELSCTQILLVNIAANAPTIRKENWIYVYDEEKLSTRINFTESLSKNNAPIGSTGIQVEVYTSRYKKLDMPLEVIKHKVEGEILDMNLISENTISLNLESHIKKINWGNIIFSLKTPQALNEIWNWLEHFGLEREEDDLHPLTDWKKKGEVGTSLNQLIMSGRYAQWKYYWSDDCVLRGKEISKRIKNINNE